MILTHATPANSVKIMVNKPYDVLITIGMEKAISTDGNIWWYDYGTETRESTLSYISPPTTYSDANRSSSVDLEASIIGARAREFIVDPTSPDAGVYPFGADLGNSDTFNAAISKFDLSTPVYDQPYRWSEGKITLKYLSSVTSDYVIPDGLRDGAMTICGVSGLRFPDGGFKAKYDRSWAFGGTYDNTTIGYIDIGAGAEYVETDFSVLCDDGTAGHLIEALLSSSGRGAQFVLNTPNGYYPFGSRYATGGNFSVKLADNRIRMSHDSYGQWLIDLSLAKVN